MAAVLVAAIVTLVILSHKDSVSVRFVNDTTHSVILTDCGPGLQPIDPGQTSIINVYTNTLECTFAVLPPGVNQEANGCIAMPSRLIADTVVRISDAKPISRSHPCD